MLRAVRIVSEEGFTLHPGTEEGIRRQAAGLRRISGEREGMESMRLLMGEYAQKALMDMARIGLVEVLWPAFVPAITLVQDPTTGLTVYRHTAQAVGFAVRRPTVRLAAFGHDWGKPYTRTPEGRFPGHHRVSAALFQPVLARWRLPTRLRQHVLALIRHHMFGPLEDKTLRRWIAHYGGDWVRDLVDLREADARGTTGGPVSAHVDELRARVERILREEPPLTPNDLALSGTDIMGLLQIPPGPEVGRWKDALYQFVLEDPSRNTRETLVDYLLKEAGVAGGTGSLARPSSPATAADPASTGDAAARGNAADAGNTADTGGPATTGD